MMSLMFFSDCLMGYFAKSHWNFVIYCGNDTAKNTQLHLSAQQLNAVLFKSANTKHEAE